MNLLIQVSTITSLTLERRCSVHSKQAEEKNDKGVFIGRFFTETIVKQNPKCRKDFIESLEYFRLSINN